MNYYNEFDPKAASWIRQLIADGLIPKGEVDERSIQLVRRSDLTGFTQCHFFCGIAGWPYALYLAGFPETESVWTGSCPCQPFSQAGKGKGESDKRHLWPEFLRLIKECRPSLVFGEQVASKAGRDWLDRVRFDLQYAWMREDSREEMYRLWNREAVLRLPILSGQRKEWLKASLQNLPEGIREEVEIGIARLQERAEAEEQGEGQDIQAELFGQKQDGLFSGGMPPEVREVRHTVRPGHSHERSRRSNAGRGVRVDWVSASDARSERPRSEQSVSGQNRPEGRISLRECPHNMPVDQHGDGGMGRVGVAENSAEMDRGLNVASEISGYEVAPEDRCQRIDGVWHDMEELAYEVGAADLCSPGVRAPHIRQRLYWMAQPEHTIGRPEHTIGRPEHKEHSQTYRREGSGRRSNVVRMAVPACRGLGELRDAAQPWSGGYADGGSVVDGMGDPNIQGSQRRRINTGEYTSECAVGETGASGGWDDFDIVNCEDGKSRRVERGSFPLAPRLPKGMVYSSDPGAPIDPQATGEARITRLRGYGNAITPQVAAEFIKVCMEAMGMGRKKKAPEVADPKQARCIAETIVSLGLSPEDPDNWVKAIIHADLYPNAKTVEEAQRELARMMRPPIQIATRRDAHHLRRRR